VVLFSANLILSTYHLLVIFGLIKDLCAVQTLTTNLDDFLNSLEHSAPCSHANWKFLGLPIAAYNGIASLLFLLFFRRTYKASTSFAMSHIAIPKN